jgi:hypothetical protein
VFVHLRAKKCSKGFVPDTFPGAFLTPPFDDEDAVAFSGVEPPALPPSVDSS